MAIRPDILVHDRNGQPQLVVEVRARRGTTPGWASRMRRNLLCQGGLLNAPFLLLATADSFYFWKSGEIGADVPPDCSIDAAEVLASFVDREGLSLDDLSSYGLELLVFAWLQVLVDSGLSAEAADPRLRWLLDSGLCEAIRNGSVVIEAAV
jgi:hypothetical protein